MSDSHRRLFTERAGQLQREAEQTQALAKAALKGQANIYDVSLALRKLGRMLDEQAQAELADLAKAEIEFEASAN